MIKISRALARRLRTVFRKSVPIGMRGQHSPISLLGTKDGLVLKQATPGRSLRQKFIKNSKSFGVFRCLMSSQTLQTPYPARDFE